MPRRRLGNALGFGALLCWATTTGVTGRLVADLGPCTYAALGMGGAGLLLLLLDRLRGRSPARLLRLPRRYLLGCGLLFVGYEAGFLLALGMAPDAETVVQLGLVNYLWPACIVLAALALGGHRARWPWLIPGIALGLAGAAIGCCPDLDPARLADGLRANAPAFALMLAAAAAWGLYSALARRWLPADAPSAVPLFLLASGLALLAGRWLAGEHSRWDAGTAWLLAFAIVFPSALGYTLWEWSMRLGDVALLSAAAYALPLASTLVACWLLGTPVGPELLAGAALVMGGAVLSRAGVAETAR